MSSVSSDSGCTKTKMRKLKNDNLESIQESNTKVLGSLEKNDDMAKVDDYIHVEKDSDTIEKITDDPGSPQLPSILKKTDDESDESIIPKFLGLYLIIINF